METYPNQKIVEIRKSKYKNNFIMVGISEVEEALILLTRTELAVYFYLCANKDGYTFALSPKHITTQCKISKASYHRAIDTLIKFRYLVYDGGNHYTFYTCRLTCEYNEANDSNVSQKRVEPIPPMSIGSPTGEYTVYSPVNREIDNINNINKIDNPSVENFGEQENREPELEKNVMDCATTSKAASAPDASKSRLSHNPFNLSEVEQEQDERFFRADVEKIFCLFSTGADSLKQLREKGMPWEWIDLAAEPKKEYMVEHNNAGLLFQNRTGTNAYPAEVTAAYEERLATYRRIAKSAEVEVREEYAPFVRVPEYRRSEKKEKTFEEALLEILAEEE